MVTHFVYCSNSDLDSYLPVLPKNPVAWHSSMKVSASYFSAKSHISLNIHNINKINIITITDYLTKREKYKNLFTEI